MPSEAILTPPPAGAGIATAPLGRSGFSITRLGLGLAPIGNHHAFVPDEDAIALARHAFDTGVRYFDAAPFYGNGLAEARFGAAMRWHDRDAFVLSTKVGRLLQPAPRASIDFKPFVKGLPFRVVTDYGYDATMRSIEGSLNRLGLERIDIAYVHDIDRLTHGEDQPRQYRIAVEGAFRALAQLRSEGSIRAVGLGCNELDVFESVLGDADVDCFLVPGLYTLLGQRAAASLLPKCRARGVAVVAGSVFNSGILVTGAKAGARYRYAPAAADVMGKVAAIEAVCDRHEAPLGAVALQFVLAHPAVTGVLAGARSIEQLRGILGFHGHAVPRDLWAELREAGLLDRTAPVPGEAA